MLEDPVNTNNSRQEPAKRFLWSIGLPSIIIFAIGLIVLVVTQGLKPPDSSTQAGIVEIVQSTDEFTPVEDVSINVENVTVYIPKNASTQAGELLVTFREPDLFSDSGEPGWTRPQVINVEYRNGEGTSLTEITFSQPIEICFSFTQELWSNFKSKPDDYQIQYYAEQETPRLWQSLARKTYDENLQLCGLTDHLSLFALAIKQELIIVDTGATPTQQLYGP
jgi:hypothetical protein